ncbi:hypothetical protein B484DRAFT_455151 [Ochromonadaceae sp. CCMP2298]|nr:hypothetical protein B484DRAFT_455151 [Ochromonadaceae sp. CCMP2298]|mmetsp:Transcript_8179/g.17871  ORF Transcript_8179/g.17871 Transcript_8179/m.17871 type:complete len:232 (-) Transcript_8179:340-1035(-)
MAKLLEEVCKEVKCANQHHVRSCMSKMQSTKKGTIFYECPQIDAETSLGCTCKAFITGTTDLTCAVCKDDLLQNRAMYQHPEKPFAWQSRNVVYCCAACFNKPRSHNTAKFTSPCPVCHEDMVAGVSFIRPHGEKTEGKMKWEHVTCPTPSSSRLPRDSIALAAAAAIGDLDDLSFEREITYTGPKRPRADEDGAQRKRSVSSQSSTGTASLSSPSKNNDNDNDGSSPEKV